MKRLWLNLETKYGAFIKYLVHIKWQNIVIHFCVWIVLVLYEGVFIYKIADAELVSLAYVIPSYIIFAIFVYVHALILLPKFLERRNIIGYLLLLTGLLLGLIYIKYLIRFDVLPFFNVTQFGGFYSTKVNFRIFLALQITYLGHYLLYSIGYWYALRAIRLEKQKRKLEREILEAKADYLRFQINPHFLYNALNFFYGQIQSLSKPVSDGILQLSEMMRYALSEDEWDRKVDLEKEINHIDNFIKMQQLRFNNTCQIDFKVEGNIFAKRILPLVLITFVENVFKHGEIFEEENPAIIHIKIVQNELTLQVKNKKRIGILDPSSGVGTRNILNRLKLFYKQRFKYDVFEDENYYNCTLIIQL